MDAFWHSTTFLFVLLNPFMMMVYLLPLIRELEMTTMTKVLVRASVTAGIVFIGFAATGTALFRDVLNARFEAFMVFGGLIFLFLSIRSVVLGAEARSQLVGGPPEHIAGSVAMPFMIGPGTVSASAVAGTTLPLPMAVLSIVAALTASGVGILALKYAHDHVQRRYEGLVERYIDIVGRISHLVVGTIAVEMIFQGLDGWIGRKPLL